jgi:hypothetical protein
MISKLLPFLALSIGLGLTACLGPISKSSEQDNEAGELEVSRPGNFTAGLS